MMFDNRKIFFLFLIIKKLDEQEEITFWKQPEITIAKCPIISYLILIGTKNNNLNF